VTSEAQYRRAKAHVARGHETEKRRLQRKGRIVPVIGPAVGEYVADKRLELSQKRGPMGRYSKYATAISETAAAAMGAARAVKRPLVKPPVHKPMVVKTPAPVPPQVAAATQSPAMSPIAKMGAMTAIKKLKAKKAVDDMGEPRQTWQGSRVRRQKPGPENEPEPESWRGHDF
jgi:hypothetical protein